MSLNSKVSAEGVPCYCFFWCHRGLCDLPNSDSWWKRIQIQWKVLFDLRMWIQIQIQRNLLETYFTCDVMSLMKVVDANNV